MRYRGINIVPHHSGGVFPDIPFIIIAVSAFGKTPPNDKELIRAFLKDDRFLLTSPNDYNKLGLGTTQLYNKVTVHNHKRHGEFKLGNRYFSFQRKPDFPKKVTTEFLLVV